METVTLKKLEKDINEVKIQLNKITHILTEDFELSESAKKALESARKEPLSDYVDHEEVLKEFA